jgi:hypothetical protein
MSSVDSVHNTGSHAACATADDTDAVLLALPNAAPPKSRWHGRSSGDRDTEPVGHWQRDLRFPSAFFFLLVLTYSNYCILYCIVTTSLHTIRVSESWWQRFHMLEAKDYRNLRGVHLESTQNKILYEPLQSGTHNIYPE